MDVDWMMPVLPILAGVVLMLLSGTGFMRALASRPAVLMLVALCGGYVYRLINLPFSDSGVIGDFADSGLALLVYAATLQFRLTRINRQSPAPFNLSIIGGPAYAIAAALSAYVLLPSMSFWSCLVIGGALMLNGAVIDQRTVLGSSVPEEIKSGVALESRVTLAIALPLIIMLETAAVTPSTNQTFIETGMFRSIAGFAIGGSVGLVGSMLSKRGASKTSTSDFIPYAFLTGVVAFCLAQLFGGTAIIAAAAAGLLWSEDSGMALKQRQKFHRLVETAIVPATCIVFGFTLGPRVLQADILVILFALSAVTLLRVVPRLMSLKSQPLPREQQAFLAWFGGAPGVASALYLLHIVDSPIVIDQENVLTIGTVCLIVSILGTRLSTRPLAKYFVRQSALAKQRQYYAR